MVGPERKSCGDAHVLEDIADREADGGEDGDPDRAVALRAMQKHERDHHDETEHREQQLVPEHSGDRVDREQKHEKPKQD